MLSKDDETLSSTVPRTVLSMERASAAYKGFRVLHEVSFSLQRGVFHSLIGPNGAGKTTLIGALSGHLALTGGRVYFKERDVTAWTADKRARAGIGRSFQRTNLFPALTALESVQLSVLGKDGVRVRNMFRRSDAGAERAMRALNEVLLQERAYTPASHLSHGDKRKLEMAMLLAQDPEVLLLDEPTAGMSQAEAESILDLIHSLKNSGEYAILLVEHKLEAVMRLSDVVTVLAAGEILATGAPGDIMKSPEVEQAYLGGSRMGGNHGSTA